MDDDLRELLCRFDNHELSRLSRCFRLAEQVLGSPEEQPVAFAELVVQLYSADLSVEIDQPRPDPTDRFAH